MCAVDDLPSPGLTERRTFASLVQCAMLMLGDDKCIQIESIRNAASVLSKRNLLIAKSVNHFAMVCFVCNFAMVAWAFNHPFFRGAAGGGTKTSINQAFVVWLGVILMIVAFFISAKESFLINLWLRSIMLRAIRQRSDSLLDPDGLGCRFVALLPRNEWDNPAIYKATDVGILAIDSKAGLVLFEGDNQRFRIPAAALVECAQEYSLRYTSRAFLAGYASRSYSEHRYFFAVVKVQMSAGECELPFWILAGKGCWRQETQAMATLDFVKELRQLKATIL